MFCLAMLDRNGRLDGFYLLFAGLDWFGPYRIFLATCCKEMKVSGVGVQVSVQPLAAEVASG